MVNGFPSFQIRYVDEKRSQNVDVNVYVSSGSRPVNRRSPLEIIYSYGKGWISVN